MLKAANMPPPMVISMRDMSWPWMACRCLQQMGLWLGCEDEDVCRARPPIISFHDVDGFASNEGWEGGQIL